MVYVRPTASMPPYIDFCIESFKYGSDFEKTSRSLKLLPEKYN
jgi:hypothetical protein